MKIVYTVILLFFIPIFSSKAQYYYADNISVHFFCNAPISDIDAVSNSATVYLNVIKKEVKFTLPITSFVFKKALMQEHFNGKYLESHKYPLAVFKGSYTESIDLAANESSFKLNVKGKLNLHGTEKTLTIPCNVTVKENNIEVNSYFKLKLKDFKIDAPMVFNKSVAEEVDVTVNGTLVKKIKK